MTVTKTMRVGRKKKPEKEKLKVISIAMACEMIEAINTVAGRRKFSAWLREVAEKELKK